ncbi:sugar ABC transporter ATP-binding protein [Microbacterium esteraromaticum]|uniref:sugar ABC transporter ATP-binding protein n=1 Tax=Microbacterium esteraromaticum TaxID=57043 RepID=UPI0019D3479F|nr:sugar ABC transporter ATP-binding protein [Microbacterium esteraromaticum]MBN7794292.1 sugar ABC transporter ATP-binding protein [Microbacterium esteraromaticum]MCA1306631.1 sugar ABC transporter ATP-binding protein [Microbacterium esteraromaticum]WDH78584.1 sugar ABC transporter ATP-binding protein [Microbacterium esteraromaticum]
MTEPILRMAGISKGFPGVQALQDVNLEVRSGEVLVLVGENGAGKSTLMKILSGIYTRDEGTIHFEGQPVELTSPLQAQQLGITIIHQELNMMPDLTVAQNIYIGREPKTGPFLSERALNKQTDELLARLGIRLDARQKVGELTVAEQQMVEIAKALSFNAKVLIMDEPTSALTDTEVETLFVLIEQLKQRGTGIVYISHRMDELRRLADRVSVLRDGAYIGSLEKSEISIPRIIEMMVGRAIDEGTRPEAREHLDDPVVLDVQGLSTKALLKDVSFQLHRGEILGFAGLMGAGRTETARAVIGADRKDAGTVSVAGKVARIRQPEDAVKRGIGYLSEDRKLLGLMLDQDVTFNTVLASLDSYANAIGWMGDRKAKNQTKEYVQQLRVKTPSVNQIVKLLSGGNQQKVVIARWLMRDCDILIFDEPTRGIDVGAKEEIYRLMQQLAASGKSIIVISSELPEILRVANRIAVFANGRITGTLRNEEASQEKIMQLAAHGEEEQ